MYQYAFEIVLCSALLSAVEADLVGVAIILDHSYMHTLAVTCNVFLTTITLAMMFVLASSC